MDELVSARSRRVFVLGREATLDVEDVARRVIAEGAELILLTLGYPVAPKQAVLVNDALRLADQLRLWLDTVLVTSPRQVADLIREGDDVTILASGSERRNIERALGTNSGSLRVDRSFPSPARRPVSAGVRRRGTVVDNGTVPEDLPPVSGPAGSESVEVLVGSESVEDLAGREVAEPARETVWTRDDAQARKQGTLRVYLGSAPGVGKTFAMLGEGQRRRSRGTDVVVGVVHAYDRPKTLEMLEGLEIVPPRTLAYRGTTFEEMDGDAVIERKPEVALVDELAHTNIPGSRRAKRWEDVMDILAAGVTVITTLNVQHLASVNDVVAKVTGIRQQETVPDWILDLADDVELVDMSPGALQRRMVHGNIYRDPRKAELALRRFFTTDNLTALRELALMRVANRVDDALLTRWSRKGTPETRERILVCVSRPGVSEDLIRRGGRIAQRTQGDLFVVHVSTGEGEPDPAWIEQIRRLTQDLGGDFEVLPAEDPVEAVLSFAYQQHVTQILVGESLRSRWQELLRGSFVNQLIRKASNVDVHVISRRER
jgi:nucleotide-binding universal stress UspA family protein